MIELARGLSFVHYTYEGGPLRFTVPFPYLLQEHVRVLVGGLASPRYVLATWVNATTIEIPSQAPSLSAPYSVMIRRVTPVAQAFIEFQGGAMLPDSQLNAALRQLLYAHQELREFPVPSPGSPGGGTNPGGGSDNIDIQTLVNLVTQSPAFQALQQRIPDMDANAELIMEELLRSNTFFDRHRDHADKITSATTRLTVTESATSQLAEQYTELFARVQTNESDAAAQYTQLNQALATETSARVSALTDLHAQITTETGTTVAQAVSAVTAEVTAVDARVTSVEGVVASQGDQIAAANTALSANASNTEANTTWRQLFSSSFGGSGLTGTQAAAAVKTQIDTKVTATEAQSIANTSVTAFANGTFAALQQSYTAYVNSNDNRWAGTWTLRINGGDPANPVIAGIALSANPEGSDFVVQADRFAIVSPSALATKKFPFVVGTVGGVSTVGVTGQLLVDGSVTATKLQVGSLSAITANAGTLNGGTFRTHTLDANGNVTDALEFRAEMSNVGTWPLWIGAGVKNENNAVFWIDKTGAASFKGKVTAPNIVGVFQAASIINWTGATTISTYDNALSGHVSIPGFTEITQFTLPAPVLVGESHTPVVNVSVEYSSLPPGVIVAVDEMRTSIWVEIGRWESPLTYGLVRVFNSGIDTETFDLHMMHSASSQAVVICVGQATSSVRTFRVRAMFRSNVRPAEDQNPGQAYPLPSAVNVTAVRGYAYGIR
jgi:hypothetical protein